MYISFYFELDVHLVGHFELIALKILTIQYL